MWNRIQHVAIFSAVLMPVDVSPFHSGISHWRNIRDETRFIQPEKEQPSYSVEQVREIVDNILLFQRTNGGWPKDYDMLAVLTDSQRSIVEQTRNNEDASYDNGNIHSQVEYLAQAYSQESQPTWREACERGFDFLVRLGSYDCCRKHPRARCLSNGSMTRDAGRQENHSTLRSTASWNVKFVSMASEPAGASNTMKEHLNFVRHERLNWLLSAHKRRLRSCDF